MSEKVSRTNQTDLLAAVLVGGVGAAGLWFGRELSWGTASRMGPGYLPLGLSWILIIFAVLLGGRGFFSAKQHIERFSAWPALLITCAVAVFALALERVGLATTVFVVAMIASYAGPRTPLAKRVIVSGILAASCVIVFVYLLGQPISVWW